MTVLPTLGLLLRWAIAIAACIVIIAIVAR